MEISYIRIDKQIEKDGYEQRNPIDDNINLPDDLVDECHQSLGMTRVSLILHRQEDERKKKVPKASLCAYIA